jgi:hypothetical protein
MGGKEILDFLKIQRKCMKTFGEHSYGAGLLQIHLGCIFINRGVELDGETIGESMEEFLLSQGDLIKPMLQKGETQSTKWIMLTMENYLDGAAEN